MSTSRFQADFAEFESLLASSDCESEAPELHGSLCALISSMGEAAFPVFVAHTAGERAGAPELRDLNDYLAALFAQTWGVLNEGAMGFVLLLPDDSAPIADRTEAVAAWAGGFLHGLGASSQSQKLSERLQAEPLQEVVQDLLAISRVCVDDEQSESDSQNSLMELEEYLRVVAQLVFEELADLRLDSDSSEPVRH